MFQGVYFKQKPCCGKTVKKKKKKKRKTQQMSTINLAGDRTALYSKNWVFFFFLALPTSDVLKLQTNRVFFPGHQGGWALPHPFDFFQGALEPVPKASFCATKPSETEYCLA